MLQRIILTVLLLLNCFLLYQFLWGTHSLNQYLELKTLKAELKNKVADIKRDNLELSKEIRMLKNSSHYMEKVIRSKMNLLHSNEVIYLEVNSGNATK